MKEVSKDDLVLNCANPEGEAGLQTLERMNISHGELTKWGLSHIEINRDDQLLDVGCGGGMALYRAAKCNPCGRCYGLDISEQIGRASCRERV